MYIIYMLQSGLADAIVTDAVYYNRATSSSVFIYICTTPSIVRSGQYWDFTPLTNDLWSPLFPLAEEDIT